MTLLWKILFIMLKRNDLATKLFLELYLVIIYVYTCVYRKSAHTQGVCVFTFVFSLLFLGLTMTPSLCLSTILRFNKSGLFYLKTTPCVILMYRIKFCCCMVSWRDLQIDICIYIFFFLREKNLSFNHFSLFSERNNLVVTILLFISLFHISFVSDITSSCIPFVVYRKATPFNKTSVILFGI